MPVIYPCLYLEGTTQFLVCGNSSNPRPSCPEGYTQGSDVLHCKPVTTQAVTPLPVQNVGLVRTGGLLNVLSVVVLTSLFLFMLGTSVFALFED